ncbi:JAB domain-containing protein [uncultured Sphingomonas sp.]|uniref:JAB domain-containing protein n=1 Tax=uncultured Sphingomonas sp. TaxID=158754 RepID=UPI0025DD60AC|nr:JAB domain-containing protein [uncultured Sphingomonas sp.]
MTTTPPFPVMGPVPAAAPGLVVTRVAVAARLFAGLAEGTVERAAVLYLDPKRRLLGRIDVGGGRASVALSLRMVIAGALAHDAAALILGHGHPSGDATPSPADLAYTRALARVCAAVEVELLDHLILAGDRITSLRALGIV